MTLTDKEFKKLQADWDAKLKESGFEDAETRDGNLKTWHKYDVLDRFSREDGETKMEYFAAAGRFLHDYQFESLSERTVWQLHCEGLSIRQILKAIKDSKVKSKWKVHQIVQKLKAAMVNKWRE